MSRESKRRAEREQQRTSGQQGVSAEPTTGDGRTPPAQFLREVRGELRKVHWPSRREVGQYTIVVLVTTLFLVAVVWGMDEVIRRAVINTLG